MPTGADGCSPTTIETVRFSESTDGPGEFVSATTWRPPWRGFEGDGSMTPNIENALLNKPWDNKKNATSMTTVVDLV